MTDTVRRQVLRVSSDSKVTVVCGSGNVGLCNGAGEEASFNEPTGICREGSTLYVADAGGSVRLIVTNTAPMCAFLKHMHDLLAVFGVHLPNKLADRHTLSDAIACLSSALTAFTGWNQAINQRRGTSAGARVQGPQGGVPSQTVRSIEMLLETVRSVHSIITRINPSLLDKFRLSSFLTLCVENFFAVMRSRNLTPTFLEFMQSQMVATKEIIRRLTRSEFHIFTSPHSHYSTVDRHDGSVTMAQFQFPRKVRQCKLTKGERLALQQFADQARGLRQLTVRQQTTKFRSGSLPKLAYSAPAVAGPVHDFSGPGTAPISIDDQHPFNESFTSGQWLALAAASVAGADMEKGLFLLARCLASADDASSWLVACVFVSQPHHPCVFSVWEEASISKSAVFSILSADCFTSVDDENCEVELDSDMRDELISHFSRDGDDAEPLDSDDNRELEEKVIAAASSSASRKAKSRSGNGSRRKRKRRVRTSAVKSKQSDKNVEKDSKDGKDEKAGTDAKGDAAMEDQVRLFVSRCDCRLWCRWMRRLWS